MVWTPPQELGSHWRVLRDLHFPFWLRKGMLGGGSKRAGHLPWGTVGDLRMRRSQEESLWGTRWAGGLEQQLLGQRWVSEICIMRHHRGHAPRDVVKHCTGLVVGQYVPCLNWTGLNWAALIELKMLIKVENKSCQNKLWMILRSHHSQKSAAPLLISCICYLFFEIQSLEEKLITSLLPRIKKSGLVGARIHNWAVIL